MTSCEEFLNELDAYVFADPNAELCNRFRAHLDTCDLCRKELAQTQEALNCLPAGLSVAPLRQEVKQKIDARIDTLEPRLPGLFNFNALKWEDSPIPGVRLHWLRQDSAGTAALLRISPGYTFPDHRHVGAEDCLVLQGGFRDSRGEYDRGDYVHYDAGTEQKGLQALDGEDCILFLVNQQGIEF